jgi:chromate reductase
MKKYKIAVIVGSLRKESFNLKVAKSLMELAPSSLSFDIVSIGDLAMFNEDLEDTPPQEWVAFRESVKSADGVLFLTPEYNRSVPGVLKNAIDVGSRPYGENAFDGKPAAVVSVSPSAIGAFGANHHLRQSLVFLNMPTMAQPEAYIGGVADLYNEEGSLTNSSTKKFLKDFIKAFENWVASQAK